MKKSIFGFCKKTLCVILSVVMLLTVAPAASLLGLRDWLGEMQLFASAADNSGECGDNLEWSFNTDTNVLTISGTGDMYDGFVEDYEYTIGPGAGYGCFSCVDSWRRLPMEGIEIEDGVTSIGECAFYDCCMKSISIPNSVGSIGNYAFDSCDWLADVDYQGAQEQWNAISIGFNNTPLTNATLHCLTVVDSGNCGKNGDNVTWSLDSNGILTISGTGAMADYASYPHAPWYSYRSSITSAVIESGVTSIGNYAFYFCDALESVTIGNSVTSIGDDAFYYCTALQSVTIPNSVTSIGNYAFRLCTALESVSIPNSVTSIGKYAFSDCAALESVTIPNGVTSIGNYAFYNCAALTELTIGEGVTSIGDRAFRSCTALESVTIPNSVTSIGSLAFVECTALQSITVDADNPSYASDESGCLFNKDKTTLIQYPIGNARTSFTIPNSVTSIGNSAFEYCTALQSVTIPNSVTSIGDSAFYYCRALQSITIPNSVTSIGDRAFYICDALESVTIPNSVTSNRRSGVLYLRRAGKRHDTEQRNEHRQASVQ